MWPLQTSYLDFLKAVAARSVDRGARHMKLCRRSAQCDQLWFWNDMTAVLVQQPDERVGVRAFSVDDLSKPSRNPSIGAVLQFCMQGVA